VRTVVLDIDQVGEYTLTPHATDKSALTSAFPNALTRYSQDVDSYETATELEEIGADIMAMDERAWSGLMDLAKAMR